MRYRKYIAAMLGVSLSGAASAAELRVQAPVINVEPIRAPALLIEECPEKPPRGLAATLRWDLGLSCTTRTVPSDRIDGYRVFYRWDDRVHSQVMATRPGETVSLTLKIN